jgi:hypothetical protein
MPPVMAAPDLSEDQPACDGSTWQQDHPQVPGLHPGWPVAKVHCSAVVAASNHELLVRKQSRRAEMTPAALPCWVRMAKFPVADHAIVFARRRKLAR